MKIITNNERQTFALAKKYAASLKGGEVIGLIGELGAGKTIFVKGLAAGLGVKQTINSPTFMMMKIYQVRKAKDGIRNFVHIDAYRIKKAAEINSIGLTDYFGQPDTVIAIEWAEKIKKILPKKTKFIRFYHYAQKRVIVYSKI